MRREKPEAEKTAMDMNVEKTKKKTDKEVVGCD